MVLGHNINDVTRTQDIKISEDITFDSMLLTDKTLRGLKTAGFYRPSPIQLHGIPLGKCGFDLLLEAKSGTGKTAVFTIIALEKIDIHKGLQTVILAPTREIAAQICDVIKAIGEHYEGLCVEVVLGGLPVQEDIEKFKKKVHIVVGSPGRLRHLITDKIINTSAVRLIVLDEADKLVEKSFQADINCIFSFLPKQKQVIMSSATFTEDNKTFIGQYVQSAQHICPDSSSILLGIAQKVTTVQHNSNIVRQTQHRFQELLKILAKIQFKQCLVFCNYQVRVGEVYKMLVKNQWPTEQLYGQQEQVQRLDALKTLQEYKCRILIATDLAARGIDASNVDLVVNFEPPLEWQTYLHRIGRAGRFGSYGTAITILSEGNEAIKFKNMLGSIVNSLNMSYLWSEEKLKTNSNCDDSPLVIPSKLKIPNNESKTYNDKLWDLFTSTNTTENNVESFNNLCLSFNECNKKVEVESFSILLESYQSYDPQTDIANNSYKTLKVNTPIYSEFKAIVEKAKQHDEKGIHDQVNDHNDDKHYSLDNGNTNIPKEDYKKKIAFENAAIRNNGITTLEQSLLEAGLPSSFFTRKNTYTKSKGNKSGVQSKRKNINNTETINKSGNDKNNNYNCDNEVYANNVSYNKNYIDDLNRKYDKCNNKKIISVTTPKPLEDPNITKCPKNKLKVHSKRNIENDIEYYLRWYNKVINQRNQIEYAIYMHEILN